MIQAGVFKRIRRKVAATVGPVFSLGSFLTYAPLLVVVLCFYCFSLLRHEPLEPYIYLFLGLLLTASGVLGLKPAAAPVLLAIIAGETAGWLSGTGTPFLHIANGTGLLLAASVLPVIARTRTLMMAASAEKLTRQQISARLNLGERLANGTTPNPAADSVQPGSGTEGMVRSLLLPAKKALRARTAMFYWYDEANDTLVPVESLSDCPDLLSNCPVSATEGRLAGLKSTREPLTFRFNPRTTHVVPIYKKKISLSGVMAVPVHFKGSLAAAFVFDREGADPFFLPETVMARRFSEIIEEALATERRLKSAVMLSQQLRMMDEAARQFSLSRTFEQVYDTAVRYSVAFSPFQSAALVHRVSPSDDEYELVAASKKQMRSLLGKRFHLRGTLCESCAKAGTFLPASFVYEPRMPQPFGQGFGMELEPGESCVLLPLSIRGEAVGFLLLADNRKAVTRDDLISLFLFADYCAVSLVNAEANKELERMAVTDPLTGIPNHRAFRSRMAEAVQRAERSTKPVSVLYIDIDHFKAINDAYGHPVGDAVLKKVAKTLSGSVRKVDFVARQGGEEFVAILEETNSTGALVMAERLRQCVAKCRMEELTSSRNVTVSIGIASYPADSKSVEELLTLADAALYRAKNEGRNRCQVA